MLAPTLLPPRAPPPPAAACCCCLSKLLRVGPSSSSLPSACGAGQAAATETSGWQQQQHMLTRSVGVWLHARPHNPRLVLISTHTPAWPSTNFLPTHPPTRTTHPPPHDHHHTCRMRATTLLTLSCASLALGPPAARDLKPCVLLHVPRSVRRWKATHSCCSRPRASGRALGSCWCWLGRVVECFGVVREGEDVSGQCVRCAWLAAAFSSALSTCIQRTPTQQTSRPSHSVSMPACHTFWKQLSRKSSSSGLMVSGIGGCASCVTHGTTHGTRAPVQEFVEMQMSSGGSAQPCHRWLPPLNCCNLLSCHRLAPSLIAVAHMFTTTTTAAAPFPVALPSQHACMHVAHVTHQHTQTCTILNRALMGCRS